MECDIGKIADALEQISGVLGNLHKHGEETTGVLKEFAAILNRSPTQPTPPPQPPQPPNGRPQKPRRRSGSLRVVADKGAQHDPSL